MARTCVEQMSPIEQDRFESLFKERPLSYLEREYLTVYAGTPTDPITTISFRRGANSETIIDEVKHIQQVWGEVDQDDEFDYKLDWQTEEQAEASRVALAAWKAECLEFANINPSDIYVVFCEDCQPIDPPLIDQRKIKNSQGEDDNWGKLHDEWNVFANWDGTDPAWQAVWHRLKFKLSDVFLRIKETPQIPDPKPKSSIAKIIFAKEEIAKLENQLVEITDIDNAPYKLVMDQKRILDYIKQWYAILAAKKVMAVHGEFNSPYVQAAEHNGSYRLNASMSQYDEHGWAIAFRKLGLEPITVKNQKVDFSTDPDFEKSTQKKFVFELTSYDAHASGW